MNYNTLIILWTQKFISNVVVCFNSFSHACPFDFCFEISIQFVHDVNERVQSSNDSFFCVLTSNNKMNQFEQPQQSNSCRAQFCVIFPIFYMYFEHKLSSRQCHPPCPLSHSLQNGVKTESVQLYLIISQICSVNQFQPVLIPADLNGRKMKK